MEEATVILAGVKKDRILQSLNLLDDIKLSNSYLVNDYSCDNVSVKIVKIIMGYVDYVNRVVWHNE